MSNKKFAAICLTFLTIIFSASASFAQDVAREEFSGGVISFNGPRTQTGLFTLRLTGRTSDTQAKEFLGILADQGQRELLDAINGNDLGSFSIDNSLGRRLNVVRESTVDGNRRIFAVFERWTQIVELRGGYRSLDYPFGIIEIFVDPRTGKGSGTFIAAARIDFDEDGGDNNTPQVEIENFATYPAKLTAITNNTQKRAAKRRR